MKKNNECPECGDTLKDKGAYLHCSKCDLIINKTSWPIGLHDKSYRMIITPEIAQSILDGGGSNRNVSKYNVKKICDAITNGKWVYNGEPIIIGKSGRLLDGQHRLLAVIKTKMSIETLVVRDVDDDVFNTIDSGKSRNAADVLFISGEKDSTILAGALTIANRYYNKQFSSRREGTLNTDILEILDKYPNMRGSILIARHYYKESKIRMISPSCLTAIHFIFSSINESLTEEFLKKLMTGEGIYKKEPVYKLREVLINMKATGVEQRPATMLALAIKAWNATRQNRARIDLSYDPIEIYPVAI